MVPVIRDPRPFGRLFADALERPSSPRPPLPKKASRRLATIAVS